MIGLQLMSGVDEHAGSEDAYLRMIRARRWLFASSIVLFLTSAGFFASDGLQLADEHLSLPASPLRWMLAAIVAYLSAQYAVVLWQLALSYDHLLRERLIKQHKDALLQQQIKIEELETEYAVAHDEVTRELDEREANLTGKSEEARIAMKLAEQAHEAAQNKYQGLARIAQANGDKASDSDVIDRFRELDIARRKYDQLQHQRGFLSAEKSRIDSHSRIRAISSRRRLAGQELDRLSESNPKGTAQYRALEKVSDLARALTPLVLAIAALASTVLLPAAQERFTVESGVSAAVSPAPETAPPRSPATR